MKRSLWLLIALMGLVLLPALSFAEECATEPKAGVKTSSSCTYTLLGASRVTMAQAGGSGLFNIAVTNSAGGTTDCEWTAQSNVSWISVKQP